MAKGSHRIYALLDAIVAILLIIAGGLIFVIGIDYLRALGTWPSISVVASAWLTVIGGLASIIYGIKRLIGPGH